MQKIKETALIWFRNDLRSTDHFGLLQATQTYERVVAYFSFDPKFFKKTVWGFRKTESFRAQFLIETVEQLQKDLAAKNISLIIDKQSPSTGIPLQMEVEKITAIYYQEEWTKEEKNIEIELKNNLSPKIKTHSYYDQFLYHPDDQKTIIDELPEIFTTFRKQCEKKIPVRNCYPTIEIQCKSSYSNKKYKCPTLVDLGLEEIKPNLNTAFPFKGGSSAAQKRITHYFWQSKKLSFYKKTRNGMLGVDYSSKLSAWLANGSISARQIYWEVKRYEQEIEKNQSTYWLIFELLWRDYFKYIALKHQNKIFQIGGIFNIEYHWETDLKSFERWIDGKTGEPFVNANMLELKKTGWMSNRGRQNVASFFSKNLLMDWRMGAAYFESLLIDYDVHSNYGNWAYVSGVGNDPRDRKFNISFQAERYDSSGKFQRLWCQQNLFE